MNNHLRPLTICLLLLLLLLMLLMSGTAAADFHSGYYAGAWFGIPVLETTTATDDLGRFSLEADPGSCFGVGIGYDLIPGWSGSDGRIEIDYNRFSNSFSAANFSDGKFTATGDLQVQSLMVNTFAVFHNTTLVSPYLGLGLGGAMFSVDKLSVSDLPLVNDDTMAYAWQVGCGVEMAVTNSLRFDLGYRFFSASRAEFVEVDGRKVKFDYATHTGLAGLVFLF
jgi:opacity protein-like surface antigen